VVLTTVDAGAVVGAAVVVGGWVVLALVVVGAVVGATVVVGLGWWSGGWSSVVGSTRWW
jgi:hypothetical protein